MSNKKWRTPAREQEPAVDPSTVPGSDEYAMAALLRTVAFLDEFVQRARAALKSVGQEALDAVLKQAKPEPEPQAQAADHRKHPRGAAHPILVLHRLGASAARLLKQLLRVTNPGVFDDDWVDETAVASGLAKAEEHRRLAEARLAGGA